MLMIDQRKDRVSVTHINVHNVYLLANNRVQSTVIVYCSQDLCNKMFTTILQRQKCLKSCAIYSFLHTRDGMEYVGGVLFFV